MLALGGGAAGLGGAGSQPKPSVAGFREPSHVRSHPRLGSEVRQCEISLSAGNVWLLGSTVTAFPGSLGFFYGTKDSSDPSSNKGALFLTADPDPAPGTTPPAVDSFTINILHGFNGAFSLDFAGQGDSWVTAYDASGRSIFSGGPKTEANCALGYACHWSTLAFDLGANVDVYSIVVHGVDSALYFDNLSFANVLQDTTPPGNIPEPGGIALSMAALGALAWTRKRITMGKRG